MPPVVSALYVHPVKACRAIAVARAALDRFGLARDRRFLVVDECGRFLSQRDTPRLALVSVDWTGELLTFQAPGVEALQVPDHRDGAEPVEVAVWRDTVRALDLGGAVAGWLSVVLQRPARLVAPAPDFARPVRRAVQAADEVAFQDAHPLLVISEESLAELNGRLDAPLPMDRFRPNLVIGGAEPFAEDRWRRIRIGDCILRASGPCARCVVTTTNQQTLERGKEPLRTLATYRRGPEGEVFFGQNYVHETKSGELAVGMPVEVLA